MRKRKAQAPDLEKYLEGKGRRFVNYAQGAKNLYVMMKGQCFIPWEYIHFRS